MLIFFSDNLRRFLVRPFGGKRLAMAGRGER